MTRLYSVLAIGGQTDVGSRRTIGVPQQQDGLGPDEEVGVENTESSNLLLTSQDTPEKFSVTAWEGAGWRSSFLDLTNGNVCKQMYACQPTHCSNRSQNFE